MNSSSGTRDIGVGIFSRVDAHHVWLVRGQNAKA
jgi:hypothetical protein